ncbi:MAG: hypothetical protein JSW45_05500 [Thiotrichales bacterium]|nr:MAG: hypothetical protein JSW45_05500 [Thiotrichales bacterium]
MYKLSMLRFIFPFTAVLLVIGCSSSEDAPAVATFDPFAVSWDSGCRNLGSLNISHTVSFDATDNTFSGNSASFRDIPCTSLSRAGRNVLGGTYSVGSDIVTPGGFVATELNIVYDPTKVANVLSFDPAPFDIAYLDPNTNIVYFGVKTATQDGTTAARRPTTVDFNNAWTTQ